jgi:UDP-N-acetyl-D-mannosaminuronate dehydrogenase
MSKRLMERGVNVKINDPYYTSEEIMKLAGTPSFDFPKGLREFDCIVIVAGHRVYRAIAESQLKAELVHCKIILDNLEETWKNFSWPQQGPRYLVAGDQNWLLK